MKRHLLAAAILIASPLPLRAQSSAPLPLDDAIQLALAHNRQVSAASLQIDKAGDALAIARTKRLPIVDVNVQGAQLLTPLEFTFPTGAFGNFPTTGPIPPAETSISTPRRPAALLYATVAQPLSQLGRINLGVRAADLDRQAERERLRRTRQSITAQVKRLYYGILQAESALEATNESIALYRELHRVMTERLVQQVVLKGDGLAFAHTLPPGYRLEIGGEYEEQVKGFTSLAIVMAISIGMIFLALVLQFRHAVKPFIVFAAIPYGMVGAIGMLWIMGAPFGFMAFLGIASLIGVIVSHIIVLFDFIEEAHARGEPLQEALLDAGIVRLRPVLITVAATVIALVPLARNGGPLWQPLCYAQIGGLTVATVVTLLLVPVIYAVFVLDLKWVAWEKESAS